MDGRIEEVDGRQEQGVGKMKGMEGGMNRRQGTSASGDSAQAYPCSLCPSAIKTQGLSLTIFVIWVGFFFVWLVGWFVLFFWFFFFLYLRVFCWVFLFVCFFPQIIFKCSFVSKDSFTQGRSLFQLSLINSSLIEFSISYGHVRAADMRLRMDQATPKPPVTALQNGSIYIFNFYMIFIITIIFFGDKIAQL